MLFLCADKPENVTLSTSSISVCKGSVVTFTCTARANPPVHTYRLYKNGSVIENLGGSGVTTKALNTPGQFIYSCDASNSVGTNKSSNTVLTVEGEFALLTLLQCFSISIATDLHSFLHVKRRSS